MLTSIFVTQPRAHKILQSIASASNATRALQQLHNSRVSPVPLESGTKQNRCAFSKCAPTQPPLDAIRYRDTSQAAVKLPLLMEFRSLDPESSLFSWGCQLLSWATATKIERDNQCMTSFHRFAGKAVRTTDNTTHPTHIHQ